MTSRKRQRLAATAAHEAGHVVMCLYQEVDFEHVTIRPDDDSLGAVYRRLGEDLRAALETGTYLETVAAVESLVRIALAGGVAVGLTFPGRRRWWGCEGDFEAVDSALFSLYDGEADSLACYRQHRRHLQLQTEQILRLKLPALWLQWIRKALLQRETLTRAEVGEVIQRQMARVVREGAP